MPKRRDAGLAEERLSFAMEAAKAGLYDHYVPLDERTYHSEGWARLLGLRLDDLPPANVFLDWLQGLVHPDDRQPMMDAYEAFVSGRSPDYHVEVRIRHADGHWLWVEGVSTAAERDAAGRVRRVVGLMRDITDRKQAEQQQELLSNELNHRVMNVLSVIQALAVRTADAAQSIDTFSQAFLGRLHALARAQNVLGRARWRDADFKLLVEQSLETYRRKHPDIIEIKGEPIAIKPEQAAGVSLILHELGTNAARHGALAHPGGRLDIAWDVERGEPSQQLRFQWQEQRAPTAEPPGQGGLGTELIERICTYELRGECELTYAPKGLTCELSFPLS